MKTKLAPRSSGFTLVELVMVIILIGVLSALGIGLFAGRSAFSPLLATQQLSSATLLAQQAALAGKSNAHVVIADSAFSAEFEDDGNISVLQSFSLEKEEFQVDSPVQRVYFDSLAAPTDGSGNSIGSTAITVSKDGTSFILCISSLGAVYQVASTGGCDG